MSSKSDGAHDKKKAAAPKRPVIHLDKLKVVPTVPTVDPRAAQPQQQHPTTSSTTAAGAAIEPPIMDGITTTSGMEMPFDIDQDDVIFQHDNGQQEQTKDAIVGSSRSANHAKHDDENGDTRNASSSPSTTESEDDSSIDIPIPTPRKESQPTAKKRQGQGTAVQSMNGPETLQRETATAAAAAAAVLDAVLEGTAVQPMNGSETLQRETATAADADVVLASNKADQNVATTSDVVSQEARTEDVSTREMSTFTSDDDLAPMPPSPDEVIAVVVENDVLCGPGKMQNHVGNIKYRDLCKQYQRQHLKAKHGEKQQIAQLIVDTIRRRNGRFLKKHVSDNTWRDIGNTKAREKTVQTLIQGARELREDSKDSVPDQTCTRKQSGVGPFEQAPSTNKRPRPPLETGEGAAETAATTTTTSLLSSQQETVVHDPLATSQQEQGVAALPGKDAITVNETLEEQATRRWPPSDQPPTKRPRREELSISTSNLATTQRGDMPPPPPPHLPCGATAVDNKENTPSTERETPPFGELPRPDLNEEEQRLFDKIERMILDDEWQELHDKIENDISQAEEEDLMSRIDQSIRAAEEASKPGGRVIYTAWIDDDGSLKEEYRKVTQDPLLIKDETRHRRLVDTQQERVSCVEDIASEVSHKIRLPKYARNSKDRLLTRDSLNAKIVGPILAQEHKYVIPRRLMVRLIDNDPDDPYSVVLHCQGHPALVGLVGKEVTTLTSANQRRKKARRTPSPEESDGQRRELQSEKQQRKNSAYKQFLDDYKDTKELEYTGTPIHMQRVNKVMWDCHKEVLGLTTCGEDCPCPRHLELLTRDVVGKYISHEIRKDPTWQNPLECAEHESPVGFVNHFVPRFFQRLEREFPNELPKQILQRLVLMWKEHRKTQRFGIKCSEHCPCKEGWEIVFKKGRLRENERAEDKKRTKTAKSTTASSTKIPRRRLSSERSGDVAPKRQKVERLQSTAKDVAIKPVSTRIPRRQSIDSSQSSVTGGAPASLLTSHSKSDPLSARIPRRRPSLEHATAASQSSQIPPTSTPNVVQTIGRKAAAAAAADLASPAKSYDIQYGPGEAMGFFCATEYRKNGPVCQLSSVSDAGRRKDSRLQPGAIVSDVTHANGNTQTVRTHTDLKLHYERAKKSRTSIRVRFTNPTTSPSFIGRSSQQVAQGEWTPSGEWMGPSSRGWPGGARSLSPREARGEPSTGPRTAATVFQETNVASSSLQQIQQVPRTDVQYNRPTKSQNAQSKPVTSVLKYSTNMAPARHRELPPPSSILRESVDRTARASLSDKVQGGESIFKQMAGAGRSKRVRVVQFSDDTEKRFYESQSVSYKMATEVSSVQSNTAESTRDFQSEESESKTPGTKELIDAIENKTFKDVIAVLQAGACPFSPDHAGKTPKDFVKDQLETLKLDQQHDPRNKDISAKCNDFELKRKVLSIYMEVIDTINKARFNKSWERFDVKIERIKDVCLSVSGAERPGSQVLDCRTIIKDEEMKKLPLIPMNGTILHSWRNKKSFPPYQVNYNEDIEKKMADMADPRSNEIEVRLYKGERSNEQILLGKAVVRLIRISELLRFTRMDRIEERLPENEWLTSAAIVLSVGRASDKDVMRKTKVEQVATQLKKLIQEIIRFNDETRVVGNCESLSGQIVVPKCNISFLHAALYLDKPDCVKQLMKLGADPEAPSDVGCARMLAENMLGERSDDESKEVLALLKGVSASAGETPKQTDSAKDAESKVASATGRESSLASNETAAQSADMESRTVGLPHYVQFDGHSSQSSSRSAPLLHQQGAPQSSQNDKSRVALPVFDFWLRKGEENCRFFGKSGAEGCFRGPNCSYLHVSPLVGRALDEHRDTIELDANNIIVKRVRNETGSELFTVAYREPNENVLYRAEGGRTLGRGMGTSKGDVFWYKDEATAIDALKRVMSFHQSVSSCGTYGPQSTQLKRAHGEGSDSRNEQQAKRLSKRSKREKNDRTMTLLERLHREPNLSLIHEDIFDRALRRTDWDVRRNKEGLVTATLISPVDNRMKYQPSPEGNGEWMDGTYWFRDERTAKASAFLSLLKSCIQFGVVDADCTRRQDNGRPIRF